MFKIEENIPVPSKSKDPLVQTLMLLETGESFFVPDVPMNIVTARTCYYAKKTGKRFTCRRMMGGVRVWRVR
jgi:hypothetical protein